MAAGGPVTAAEFAAALGRTGPLAPGARLAIGVSGGCDSVALLHLLSPVVRACEIALLVLTVDHGLRPESADEARWVAALAAALGHPHRILAWTGPKPRTGLPAAARAARYALMAQACADWGSADLFLAHHLDDQAETVLQRLGRGSGVDGLAAMAPVARLEGTALRLRRPLLGVPRARLEATLQARGQDWREDPSNADPRYGRTRVRVLLPQLDAAGVSAARIAGTAQRMARVRAALDHATSALLRQAVQAAPERYCRVEAAALCVAPEEIALRALVRVIRWVAGPVALREERVERLLAAIRAGGLGRGRTLGGCRVQASGDSLLVCREPAATPVVALAPGEAIAWDGRFTVRVEAGLAPGQVRALGPGRRWPDCGLPDLVAASLPGLWRGDALVARGGDPGFPVAPIAGRDEAIGCLAPASAYLYSQVGTVRACALPPRTAAG